jgi:hypothetical protein
MYLLQLRCVREGLHDKRALGFKVQAQFREVRKASANFVEHMRIAPRDDKFDRAPPLTVANEFLRIRFAGKAMHGKG